MQLGVTCNIFGLQMRQVPCPHEDPSVLAKSVCVKESKQRGGSVAVDDSRNVMADPPGRPQEENGASHNGNDEAYRQHDACSHKSSFVTR